ncbi:hypothetical protein ACQEVS_21205 [Streptomyces sp. CA-181903]|uniref:hypothetical protein n=1 Tax=Streptomyces sp. CA-181903 TaxID=3240055 RepID=UPI003D8D613F
MPASLRETVADVTFRLCEWWWRHVSDRRMFRVMDAQRDHFQALALDDWIVQAGRDFEERWGNHPPVPRRARNGSQH